VLRRAIPIFDWLPSYSRADLTGDVVAGLTGAAVLIPQSMAYATIAGLPPVVGLYASVVPLLVYTVFGRSAQIAIGPLASISIVSAVAVGHLAGHNPARFIELSAALAILVGLVHVFFGVARLGFLMRFVSEPVMTGFLAAVGVLLITTQLGPMTGVSVSTNGRALQVLSDWAHQADQTSVLTASLAIGTIALLWFAQRWKRLPSALILVMVATALSAAIGLHDHGVAILGHVPGGLPSPRVPSFRGADIGRLIPAALAITFISILESIGIEKKYASRRHERVDTDQEATAIGLANVSAGLFQGMVVTGAISRSAILDEAGARTPLAGTVSVAAVVPVLLFATGLIQDLPVPVLAGIVVVAVVPFINIAEARRLWRVQQRVDFWVLIAAFVTSLVLGIEVGIALAAALSLGMIIYRVTRLSLPELGRVPETDHLVEVGHHPEALTYPGVAILRVNSSLYFTNAEVVEDWLRNLPRERSKLHTVVLDASGLDHLDATADHALRTIAAEYRDSGIDLVVVNINDEVRRVMDASGLSDLVGAERFFATDREAIAYLERHRK
jgi:sulfate permease, SulP family